MKCITGLTRGADQLLGYWAVDPHPGRFMDRPGWVKFYRIPAFLHSSSNLLHLVTIVYCVVTSRCEPGPLFEV